MLIFQNMEGLQQKNECQSGKGEEKKCTFTDEIERVEMLRSKIQTEMRKNRKKLRQNIEGYKSKKLIIPLSFNSSTSLKNQISINLLKINSKQCQDLMDDYIEQKCQVKMKAKLSTDQQCRNRGDGMSRQMNKKWKLQISNHDMNSLFYGKQLRIGSKSRKHFITDDKIRELKSASLFRRVWKLKENTEGKAEKKVSNENRKTQMPKYTALNVCRRLDFDGLPKYLGFKSLGSSQHFFSQKFHSKKASVHYSNF